MRVLEISDCEEAAAYCAKLLARWGSEVVRVEPPGRPAPPRPLELYLHGGKRRVALDARDPAAREQIDRHAAGCDLVITDVSPRAFDALHLADLGGAGPDGGPVVVSITPFGLSGPYRDYAATAATLLALGGYTWLMGDEGRAPLTMPGRYPFYQAANFACVAALSAHLARLRGGRAPRLVEVSVLEVLATLHQFTDTMWVPGGIVRSRHGNRWQNLCPTTLLPCADGWFGMNILQNFWLPFAHWIGHPEYTEPDHPWATNPGRMEHQDEVEAVIVQALGGLPRAQVFREGQETWRVPVGMATQLGDLLEDRHLVERGFWRPLAGAEGEEARLRAPAGGFRFVGEERPVERAPEPAGGFVPPGATRPTIAGGAGVAARTAGPPPANPQRPLEGVRVVDLTRIWAGPVATRVLADLGAEVIKVEAPAGRGPAVLPPGAAAIYGASPTGNPWNQQALFNKLNRNKRSVAVDLKRAEGREAFLALVAQADVVIENFSARAMPALGLGYVALRAAKPEVIYVAMPAFGLEGPYRDYVGLGPSIEPVTGLTALMGYSDDEPRVTSKAIPDAIGGANAAVAVLTALARRARTGQGAFVDLSQHECGVAMVGEFLIERQLAGVEPTRIGNTHREYAPHGVYRCAGEDAWIALAARDDEEWRALCAVAGRGWERDPRFASAPSRREHRAALDEAIEAWSVAHEKRALMEALQARGVPAGAVLSAPEWTADPHLEARGYYADLMHPEAGPQRWDGSPICLDGGRGYEHWVAAPLLGADNDRALRDVAGLTAEHVAALWRDGVIADRPPDAG